ncbi:MAG: dockerin type I repeat-containing protein [Spirochaetales bacterium]|nr:dockerin type I repeat-containing protein [Spirochaetales bacterium]
MQKKKVKFTKTHYRPGFLFFISLFLLLIPCIIQADGGYIPLTNTLVYEPSQSAIIGWNGTGEVLILSTNVRTNNQDSNWVIELIPFPSLPEEPVAGTLESFQIAGDIIDAKIGNPQSGDVNLSGGIDIVDALLVAMYYVGLKPTGFYRITADVNGNQVVDIIDALVIAQYYVALISPPSGRLDDIDVVFKEQIGVHNITLVETENAAQLISFAEQTLAEVTTTGDMYWSEFEPIAADYISRGMKYWVIDLLDLNDTEKSRDPLVYSFKSDYLYFPLIVSSVNRGKTLIDVITITKNELDKEAITAAGFETMPIDTYFEIIPPDIMEINPELSDLFIMISSTLRIARHYYDGDLQNLAKDLIAESE